MASENTDFDQPLETTESFEEEEELPEDVRQHNANLEKLRSYVKRMAYRPQPPLIVSPHTEQISMPKRRVIKSNIDEHIDNLKPKQRLQRLKRHAGKFNGISAEQLERIIRTQRDKERKKECLLKRKQEIYYEMLTKLERQCRTQYLNVLIKKFSNFIAKLATTMRIPPTLVEPYSRMQRGLFCNILLAIGLQPSNHAAIYYNTPEAVEYEVCHKLAHALLSLIIKGLDTATTKNPDDLQPIEADFEMDNYIKDRLMCAAEKKICNTRSKETARNALNDILQKCENFHKSC